MGLGALPTAQQAAGCAVIGTVGMEWEASIQAFTAALLRMKILALILVMVQVAVLDTGRNITHYTAASTRTGKGWGMQTEIMIGEHG